MNKFQRAKRALKSFLEERGFTVWLDKALKGFSGTEHVFDVVAVKGDTVVCFIFSGGDENQALCSAAKAIDFEHTRVFLLLSETQTREVPEYLKRIKGLEVVFYRDIKDLLRKIDSLMIRRPNKRESA